MAEEMGTNYRAQIQAVRGQYLRGEIDLDQAKAKVQPMLDAMNAKGKEISKEHGMRYKPLSFGYVFR